MLKEWLGMNEWRGERALKRGRIEALLSEFQHGRLGTLHWGRAKLKGQYIGVNGKHTRRLCELHPEIVNRRPHIVVQEFDVDDMAEVGQIYQRFDAGFSARSKAELLSAYAFSTDYVPVTLTDKALRVIAAGLHLAHSSFTRKHATAAELFGNLQSERAFVMVAGEFARTPKIARPAIIAAIFESWKENARAANEFWRAVRDDTDHEFLSQLIRERYAEKGIRRTLAWEREMFDQCRAAFGLWRAESRISGAVRTRQKVAA